MAVLTEGQKQQITAMNYITVGAVLGDRLACLDTDGSYAGNVVGDVTGDLTGDEIGRAHV